ncbi:deoxyguanosinetriphosphate triphosphohydrolase [Nocardioides sp. Kera G14]|uniref:deoxyguanosinetriphosphate triphosphohydrolase n=1 Tax=Nocardioides sp. Kera G14 TaxID=2884264 RepID=UPI001D125727|nr:deoxyguanosinetriphosphate triphosphohydrolase [Nocardioides sp. Kera G14]UDY24857.1 deoxyguanosinetriphosphate triphosphohydrolase [Nocardioides sp. Kera G14]
MADLYTDSDRERIVEEPPKRVDAPVRTPFERDRARLVHAASSRRLAAKTQVVGPQSDDFVRNRLTHSLEVAQIARDISRALGDGAAELADLAETAALAHDLGHPPFGHNGEDVLHSLAAEAGGFEGNAQTLRILTRLESKTHRPSGASVGLNLTRATLDACTKYPWRAGEHGRKFGVYDDDLPVFTWMRSGVEGHGKCVEAQIMDLADDVAYSVHDVEDGVVAGRIDLTSLDVEALREVVRGWYLPEVQDAELDEALGGLRAVDGWPSSTYDGSRGSLAALKNLTSDLIGRFCGAVQAATPTEGGLVRHRGNLVIPERTRVEIAVLKGIATHYVMLTDTRRELQARQRELLTELVQVLLDRGPDALDRQFADDWRAAADDSARLRVVIDQVASLTDVTAVSWYERLVGPRT